MLDSLKSVLNNIDLPKMMQVEQQFAKDHIDIDIIPQVMIEQLNCISANNIVKAGMKIAIAVGSRGIANAAIIVKTMVDYIKSCGAYPFIVPAMGSHGGATAAGQIDVLRHYGITKQYLSCPIKATMEVVHIGDTEEGQAVFVDKIAANADGIIIFCRVKAHTAFTGEFESGIMKMLTIGLGNHRGAMACHDIGYKHFSRLIPMIGKMIIARLPILFSLAVLENAYGQTAQIIATIGSETDEKEPQLLKKAKAMMPKMLIDDYDILIIDRIGKDISGAGMDPHITGAYVTSYAYGTFRPQVICVLDLTEQTNGNAIGIGQADITTQRLIKKMEREYGYVNAIIANMLSTVKIPLIVDSDKEVVQVAIKCCEGIDKTKARIIRIQDTLHMNRILISEALLPQAEAIAGIKVITEAMPWDINNENNLW